jgi:WD40 repeat protein
LADLHVFPFGAYVVEILFAGDTAAFALGDGSVRLVDGAEAREIPAHKGAVLAAARTPDGKAFLTGGDDGRLVRTKPDGSNEAIAERPRKWIDKIATGAGGVIAYAAGRDAVLIFPDGRERVLSHDKTVGGLAFAPKGARLAVARYNGVSLWWISNDAPPVSMEWKGAHGAVTFAPDGRFLISSMQENALHGWRLADGKDLRMTGYPAKPRDMVWTVKGKYLATSGAEMAVLWPFTSKEGPEGKQPLQLAERQVNITRIAAHPRLEVIAIGYSDGAVVIAPLDKGQPAVFRKPQEGGPVSAIAFDEAGKRLAYGTEGGSAGVVIF